MSTAAAVGAKGDIKNMIGKLTVRIEKTIDVIYGSKSQLEEIDLSEVQEVVYKNPKKFLDGATWDVEVYESE